MKGIKNTPPAFKYSFLLFVISALSPADSWAISISANVSIDPASNPIVPGPKLGKADYGPFHVVDNGGTTNTGVGDGIDETWSWYFDFRGDANYKKFMGIGLTDPVTKAPLLSSAVLTLTLTSKDYLDYTDGFSLGMNRGQTRINNTSRLYWQRGQVFQCGINRLLKNPHADE